MANKMLIDATHPEETRVVVLRGSRVEEFDFESANRRQLRGNIYLAKVTRVEPSLQAAFVDYGGNRHGFLAFSEIHPDYYQIPVADRQALIEEEERAHRAAEDEAERRSNGRRSRHRGAHRRDEVVRSETIADETAPADAEGPAGAAATPEPAPDTNGAPAGDENTPETVTFGEVPPVVMSPDEAAELPVRAEAPTQPAARAEVAAPETGPAAESAEPARRPDDITAIDLGAEPMGEAGRETMSDAQFAPQVMAASEDVPPVATEDATVTSAAEEADKATDEPSAADVDDDEDEDEDDGEDEAEEEVIESVGGADALEEVPDRAYRSRRQYKIQEVIKRRQIMLVQVVKEERGTKGAALTTYLSLAGRYSVLMPNTARGGGISRKITNVQDRKRLKEIAQELEVPEGMGVILRTAGAARTKTEVKRDFEYLLRVWETVRDLTLKSAAPTLVYEEGSLVKRSIRDLYNKDIDEVIVAGEGAYHEAKDFMRMLMPSHAKNVHLYREGQPLLARFGVEHQLDAMFSPVVQLRSGGYIVINQTEALVAIDVNSGRATREHHIEDTALKTNLEASEEISRQLRLRDLAGLIVIDFIDMDEKRNNRSVERRLKECLKNDRARIQVGRISHFGLMEMSRQRIRSSVLESSTDKCPYCGGTGHVRSVSSVSLQLLRMLEDMLLKGATHNVVIRTRAEIALYVLNHKRAHLHDLEERFRITITVSADDELGAQQPYVIEKGEQVHSIEQARALAAQPATIVPAEPDEEEEDEGEAEIEAETEAEAEAEADEDEAAEASPEGETADAGDGRRRRRRRRRGRRGEGGEPAREAGAEHAPPHDVAQDHEDHDGEEDEANGDEAQHAQSEQRQAFGDANGERRRRRRGRRGGRRNRRGESDAVAPPEGGYAPIDEDLAHAVADFGGPLMNNDEEAASRETLPVGEDESRRSLPAEGPHEPFETAIEAAEAVEPATISAEPAPTATETPAPAEAEPPRRRSTVREPAPAALLDGTDQPYLPPTPAPADPAPVVETAASEPANTSEKDIVPEENAGRPRRTGWWSRK
jgi:ribonuclease E